MAVSTVENGRFDLDIQRVYVVFLCSSTALSTSVDSFFRLSTTSALPWGENPCWELLCTRNRHIRGFPWAPPVQRGDESADPVAPGTHKWTEGVDNGAPLWIEANVCANASSMMGSVNDPSAVRHLLAGAMVAGTGKRAQRAESGFPQASPARLLRFPHCPQIPRKFHGSVNVQVTGVQERLSVVEEAGRAAAAERVRRRA
jgi:hypothetical protein